MGVKHSKQSVDISSTPKKAGVPVEEINGKRTEEKTEKVEEITKLDNVEKEEPVTLSNKFTVEPVTNLKLNGEAEKPKAVNGDVPATNGDLKTEDKETPSGDAPVIEDEKKDSDEAKENEGAEAQELADTSKDEGKKVSVKDRVKKKLSMRSLNFLRKKAKSKEDGETSKNDGDADKTVEEEKTEEDKQTEENTIEEAKVEDAVKTDDVAKETVPAVEEKIEEKATEKESSTTENTEDKPPIEEGNKEE